jgi:integrase
MNQEKRARGAGRVFQRGNIQWIQYYSHGRQVRESTGETDEKRAEKILRKRLGEAEAGLAPDSRGLRYEDLRDSYLTDCETNQRKSLRRDGEGNPYLESVRRMDAFFAGCRAVEIDTDLMRKFQREAQTQGYSNGSINRSLASLRKMFTLAHRDQKIRHLPFFPMLPEAKPRKGTLPHDLYAALVNTLPSYLRLVVTIGFHTGMRLGEILGLTWENNIKWMDRLIRIEDSKNGDPREIPFSDELEKALREQFAKRQEGCDRVCFRVDRRGHSRPIGNFRKSWYRVCVKLGLGKLTPAVDPVTGKPLLERPRYAHSKPKPKMVYTGLIFHDLRRTFVTDAEHAGAPRHEAMMMSGHKTEAVYKRYAIQNREERRAALAQIEEYRAKKFGDNSGTIEGSPNQGQPVVN